MTTQTLPTTNFVISYDDDPTKPCTKRAAALAASCEREFNVLTGWFGITDGFGTDNRIQVGLTLPDGAGGSNRGYQTGGASNMSLDAQLGNNNDANADQIVRMIFVAELVDIFMDKRGQQGSGTWNRGDSSGEGLSQLCALLRAPVGHALYYSVWVNTWLPAPALLLSAKSTVLGNR
jgi:hypothetical protein